VIGAVDLAGGVENVTLKRQKHPVNSGAATLSFDQKVDGWLIGEGAGAVVLQRAADTYAKRVYATIESVAIVPGDSAETVATAVQQALSGAGITPAEVGYVEASASGITAHDQAEMRGLTQAFGTSGDLTAALGSVKANVGHTGAASGIASLIKTALALHGRFLAAVPNWTSPKQPELWANSPFYVAQESRTWFSPTGVARYALVSGLGNDRTVAQIVLSDKQKSQNYSDTEKHKALKQRGFVLFALDGDDRDALIARLRDLDAALSQGEPLNAVAARTFALYFVPGAHALCHSVSYQSTGPR
jgi:acyl transferase domain-containing protein